MPPRMATPMPCGERRQITMEEMPKIEPCEKSNPPIVMMKKTPIAAIITTYT